MKRWPRFSERRDASARLLCSSLLRDDEAEYALVRFLETMFRFYEYSLGNCLLIAFQRPDATHVAGFHRWMQLGRFVDKGEKGIITLAYGKAKKGGAS